MKKRQLKKQKAVLKAIETVMKNGRRDAMFNNYFLGEDVEVDVEQDRYRLLFWKRTKASYILGYGFTVYFSDGHMISY